MDATRRTLEDRRDEIRARVAELAKRPELGAAQGFGKRIGDGTTEAIGRLTDVGVGTSLEVSEERVTRALAKLHDATYGVCDACGGPIAPARLRDAPESELCIECARRAPLALKAPANQLC